MQVSDSPGDRSHRNEFLKLTLRLVLLCVFLCLLFSGTNTAIGSPGDQASQELLVTAPATFTGMLPCADCPGIEYHLDLFPARYYFMRMTYLERNTHFDEIGRWSVSTNGKKLVLRSGATTKTQFAIREAKILRMLDGNGNEIPTKLNYDLHRAAAFSPIEPRLKLQGSYKYSGARGTFTDCLTGNNWRIVGDQSGAGLQKAYLDARTTAGASLFATIDAKLAAKPKLGGNAIAIDQTLTVAGPFQLNPGGSCPSN